MDFFHFQNIMRKCRICKEVVGPPLVWGDKKARIVQISQAPSQKGIKNQKPFSDKGGERLRKEWYQVTEKQFYNQKNFYFTAIAHCFPGKDKKGADKKPPKACAEKWLLEEISFLKPKLFLVVGKIAAEYLFPKEEFGKLVFSDQKLNGVKCLVLPHPSPANIKWYKDNPEFLKSRLNRICRLVKKALI